MQKARFSCDDPDRLYLSPTDSVLVGPVQQGSYRFVFEGNPPDPHLIPVDDLLGVTVILLTCSYQEKEFIRIGYYVNVCYSDPELNENPPEVPDLSRLSRSILIDHPRVTRFAVDFDSTSAVDVTHEGLVTPPLQDFVQDVDMDQLP